MNVEERGDTYEWDIILPMSVRYICGHKRELLNIVRWAFAETNLSVRDLERSNKNPESRLSGPISHEKLIEGVS
jgi:hypothetical protein